MLAMSPAPLVGLRVLDLTRAISGPYCTKLLADLGADVVKVERPGRGDPTRRAGPFPGDRPDPERSGLYLHLNTSKRGITLNLASRCGQAICRELAASADVLVESFRPGRLAGWGLGYAHLATRNPRLVYVSVSGFGQTGPYRGYADAEIVAYAIGGEMYSTGSPAREPLKMAGSLVHYQAGNVAATATLGALHAAARNGRGQQVDLAVLETALGSVDRRLTYLLHAQYTGERVTREVSRGSILPGGLYPCRDGWVQCSVMPRWWDRFVRMLGEPPALMDPRFRDPAAFFDPALKDLIDLEFWTWLATRGKQEVMETAQSFRIPFTAVNTMADVVADPQLRARDYWTEVDHPKAGRVRHTSATYRLPKSPLRAPRPAPLLGEHNLAILGAELGFSRQDLVALRREGVI
jgi:crotonobetainyl-CoA:carnitine CoA-transferase CaiB-like acyl-CoA transferase